MAKKSKEEILAQAKIIIGDKNDDTTLTFLEDLSDTISDGENLDYKEKYESEVKAKEDLDKSWRTKYTERFFSPEATHTDINKINPANTDKDKDPSNDEDEKLEHANKVSFDDLFKEKEN